MCLPSQPERDEERIKVREGVYACVWGWESGGSRGGGGGRVINNSWLLHGGVEELCQLHTV